MRSVGGITVNDIGCNVGHLYKGIVSDTELMNRLIYTGFDCEPQYLDIARRRFPNASFVLSDITKDDLPSADVTVISATLEHVDNPVNVLTKLLSSTNETMVLRTFLGENWGKSTRMKPGAKLPYPIYQFSFLYVLEVFNGMGFQTDVIRDKATDSMPKFIDRGIVRTQYVILGRKVK
jgi:hypothetical protein